MARGGKRFRPTLWATIFTILGLALFLSLGRWQVHRLAWKTGLIEARAAAMAAPAMALPEASDGKKFDFRHVRVTGTFLNDRELFVAAANTRGEDGFQIVTPLLLPDGRYIFINRGFVPTDRREAGSRAAGELSGSVTQEGILRIPALPRRDGIWHWLIPSAAVTDNFWFQIDLPVMAAADHLSPEKVLPFYIEAGPAPNPGGLPIGGQTDPTLTNNHLQYAITWYAFALILTVGYILYHWREEPPQRGSRDEQDAVPGS